MLNRYACQEVIKDSELSASKLAGNSPIEEIRA